MMMEEEEEDGEKEGEEAGWGGEGVGAFGKLPSPEWADATSIMTTDIYCLQGLPAFCVIPPPPRIAGTIGLSKRTRLGGILWECVGIRPSLTPSVGPSIHPKAPDSPQAT